MKIRTLLGTVGLLCSAGMSSFAAGKFFKPENLKVGEFFENPVGMSLENLKFSWRLPEDSDAKKQTAYRLVVADSEWELATSPLWDSGKTASGESVWVSAQIPAPKSRQRLYWKVKVWDENGRESQWSNPAFFEAGLLKKSDWAAQWISNSDKVELETAKTWDGKDFKRPKAFPPTYLRKKIELEDDVASARLYVASRGIFQFYINGKKVGNDFWSPGWTDYRKRIQVSTYDVGKMLYEGETALTAIVADGWYAGSLRLERAVYGAKPALLAQLEVVYKNGKRQTFKTDASWKWAYGAITYSDIYHGENYDARKELDGWNDPDLDDSALKSVVAEPPADTPLLEPRRNTPIVAAQELIPISVKKIGSGKFIFDLGQNIAGVPKIKIPANPDRKITIRYAEMLRDDGTLYTQNYRLARSTDTYICRGYGIEEWTPLFTYHGFRYVELSGLPENAKPTADWVRGIVMHNDMERIGAFVSSNPKINLLQNCILWGQRGNFFSTPTDCPQRDERLGWTGDAQIFVPTAAFNMDVCAFFSKWVRDLADTQGADGKVAKYAPYLWGAPKEGIPAWGAAIIRCPLEIYYQYGDKKILDENYAAMQKFVEMLERSSENYICKAWTYADWLSLDKLDGQYVPREIEKSSDPNAEKIFRPRTDRPERKTKFECAGMTNHELAATAYFADNAQKLAKIAKILGRDADAQKYEKLAENIKSAFVKKFVFEDGTVDNETQTAYLFALAFDLLPENIREKSFGRFVDVLEKSGVYLRTGFLGTPLLTEVLTRFGRADLAYRLLLNEQFPSWLYTVNQGATTMWERWNSYSRTNGFGDASMNSFNHYAYGAIGAWIYKTVAGIWYDENAAGYKNIVFNPKLGGGFTFAGASHETPYGRAASTWKLSDGIMEWEVVIPPNATGKIVFPTTSADSIRMDGNRIAEKDFRRADDGSLMLESVGAGTHQILLRPNGRW